MTRDLVPVHGGLDELVDRTVQPRLVLTNDDEPRELRTYRGDERLVTVGHPAERSKPLTRHGRIRSVVRR